MAPRASAVRLMLSTKSPPSRTLCTHPRDQGWGEARLEDTWGLRGAGAPAGAEEQLTARLDGFLWSLVETQEMRVQPDLPDNTAWRSQSPARTWQP